MLQSGDIELNPGPNDHSSNISQLKICHANVRSLTAEKISDIQSWLCEEYHIITISETFLKPSLGNLQGSPVASSLDITGFTLYRKDRSGRPGGGVAVYIKESIKAVRRNDLESDSLEILWLEICLNNLKFLLGTCYRPPNETNIFWDNLQEALDKIYDGNVDKSILIGDLNCDMKTQHGSKMIQFCNNNNMYFINKTPTRITNDTSTVLDQIITSFPDSVNSCTVERPVGNSDHSTLCMELNINITNSRKLQRHIWLYDKADIELFHLKLSEANWDQCFDSNNINTIWLKWREIFLDIAISVIPNKNATIRPDDKPWYSNELRRQRRKLNRLYHIFKRERTELSQSNFKKFRQTYQKNLKLAKEDHQTRTDRFLSSADNISSKNWWQITKNYLGISKTKSTPYLDIDGKLISDPKEMSQAFNDFFLHSSEIDTSDASLPPLNKQNTYPDLQEIIISEQDVRDVIKNIKVNKAAGPDGISPRMIKMAGDLIVPSLTKLFNKSLQFKQYPSEWKQASVIPIHKKDSKTDVNNYRPVSLTSCISKLMERTVFKHVYNYIRENNIISEFQSGFTPGDSTVCQLADIYHTLCNALDRQKDVRMIFCDISKAFDKVWHEGLLYKMENIGVTGGLLDWFQSYLADRQQRVALQGQSSDWGKVKAGVPQGSVLGPILFLVYINDLASSVNCGIRMFADDTCLYLTTNNPIESTEILDSNLNIVWEWAHNWLVKFNPAKTKTLTFTRKRNLVDYPDLHFGDTPVSLVQTHKHLGVTFQPDLAWGTHLEEKITKATSMLNMLKPFKYRLSRKALELIYFTFIRPVLDYGDILWSNCGITLMESVEDVQLLAARIVTGAIKGTRHKNLYDETGWETLEKRQEIHQLKLFHKMVHNCAPTYLNDKVPPEVASTSAYNLRNSQNTFPLIPARTNNMKFSFLPSTISKWNDLNPLIRQIENTKEFVNKIRGPNRTNKLYYNGKRHLNIIHSRIRMGCSTLSAHLYSLHVIENKSCTCGHHTEDPDHYFFNCLLYTAPRRILREQVCLIAPNHFNINTLLWGDKDLEYETNQKIFEHVQLYIETSERF